MIYVLSALGLTSLVLGCMGYLVERPRKVRHRRLPEPKVRGITDYENRKEVQET